MTRSPDEARDPTFPDGDRISMFTRAVCLVARTVLSATARVRVEGLENLPRSGALIVAVNHLSNADPPFVGGWLIPALGRRMRFLAKEELFAGPVGAFLRSQGVIEVRRGGSDVDAYRTARRVLDRGEVLCIFPEGTRSKTGSLGEPRAGVSLLATRSGVRVVPIGISGTDRYIGPGARFPRFGARITLRVGQPFSLEIHPGFDRKAATALANEELMRRIATLVDPRHRGRYDHQRERAGDEPSVR